MANSTHAVVHQPFDPFIVSASLNEQLSFILVGNACMILAFCGMVTNVINLMVFVRQGLKDSVTLSLAALSFSDFGGSFFSVFLAMCNYLDRFKTLYYRVDWIDVMVVIVAWPRGMLMDISTMVTTYLCVERAISVAIPHKVKNIFTPFRSKIFILLCYAYCVAWYIPTYATQYLSWRWDPITNTSRLLIMYHLDRVKVENVYVAFTGITSPVVCFTIVVVSTYIMITKLHMASRFKAAASVGRIQRNVNEKVSDKRAESSGNRPDPKVSNHQRHQRVVFVVIVIAVVFIVCSLPRLIGITSRRLVLEIRVGGKYENLMWVMWAIVYFLEGINMSINILIYLRFSSKYKETFTSIFLPSDLD